MSDQIIVSEKFFVDRLEEQFKTEDYLTGRELDSGHGIADLVLIKLNKLHCEVRKNYRQKTPLLKEYYFNALKFIPDVNSNENPIDIDSLMKSTQISKSLLKYKILRDLEKGKYIKVVNNKYYFKVDGWVPIAKEVIAFEAKLKDWKRGFIQANRYKNFADRVFLVIPEETQHLPDQDLFKKFNIGLMTFNPISHSKKILVCAKKTKLENQDKRNLITEHFWTSLAI